MFYNQQTKPAGLPVAAGMRLTRRPDHHVWTVSGRNFQLGRWDIGLLENFVKSVIIHVSQHDHWREAD